MGRGKNGNCILKLDHDGITELAEYRKIAEIVKELGIRYVEVRDAIQCGGLLQGFKYVYAVKKREKSLFNNDFPWEGTDGFFDIDGWAKVCF